MIVVRNQAGKAFVLFVDLKSKDVHNAEISASSKSMVKYQQFPKYIVPLVSIAQAHGSSWVAGTIGSALAAGDYAYVYEIGRAHV